jgi:hypothetical protein
MDNPMTCGQGLAHHSTLPRKLGELVEALAETIDRHVKTLDLADGSSRAEQAVYLGLASRLGRVARDLQTAAQEMADQRDLPMGRHDPAALADPTVLEPFARFVTREEELLALLEESLERDRAMIAGPE